jgi:DNA uptake protein ComE-like DNA-binding protein
MAAGQRPERREHLWTANQRVALIAITVILLVFIVVLYVRNPSYVSNPQPDEPPRAAELADRIDPNTADLTTLSALPLLGEKRAKAIIDYREHYHSLKPDEVVYQRPEDLMRVRGIGVNMVDQLRPFLIFRRTQPSATTRSAR